jgi:hypothetical protein
MLLIPYLDVRAMLNSPRFYGCISCSEILNLKTVFPIGIGIGSIELPPLENINFHLILSVGSIL